MALFSKIKKVLTGKDSVLQNNNAVSAETQVQVKEEKVKKPGDLLREAIEDPCAKIENSDIENEVEELRKNGLEKQAVGLLLQFLNTRNVAEIKFLLSSILIERGEYKEALPVVESLKEDNFKPDIVEFWLGEIYEKQGNLQEAAKQYEKALGWNINFGEAKNRWLNLKNIIDNTQPERQGIKEKIIFHGINDTLKRSSKNKDRFEIKKEIGKGGAGTIYLSYDNHIKREVAFKIYYPSQLKIKDGSMFLKEATIPSIVKHPQVIKIFDFDKDAGVIIMQYMPGGSLKNKIDLIENPEDIIKLIIELCKVFGVIHNRGIVHRDIKPANILFDKYNNPVISDFGVASIINDTDDGEKVGTHPYISPEQQNGEKATPASDVFSIGIMALELINKFKVPDEIKRVFNSCINIDPRLRPQTAEMVAILLIKKFINIK